MTTRTISAALCTIALMRCGGDGSGGTNGPTGDGGDPPGTGDGETHGEDGHVPDPSNPLIQAMAGTWTIERIIFVEDGEPMEEVPNPPLTGALTVNADFPSCVDPVAIESQGQTGFCYGDARSEVGPPGDACICLQDIVSAGAFPAVLILQGDTVRAHGDSLWYQENDGPVAEGGREIQLRSFRRGVNENFERMTVYRKLD